MFQRYDTALGQWPASGQKNRNPRVAAKGIHGVTMVKCEDGMKEKIGEVTLNYEFYSGKDLYSDGEIENEMLAVSMSGEPEKALKSSTKWPVLYHFSSIRENLLEWYPFEKGAAILEIGAGCGALTGILCKKAEKVTCIELSKRRSMINANKNKDCSNLEIVVGNFEDIHIEDKYDYVTLIGVLEYAGLYIHSDEPYIEMVRRAMRFLKPEGRLIIAIENKMGLKYFNGAKEDHTGRLYSGINDYINIKNVRTFSRQELSVLLQEAEAGEQQFFYPVPDYKLPKEIYSEEIMPARGSIRNYKTNYDMDRLYSFNEAVAFDQICKDGMFPYFSNSFLVTCGAGVKCGVLYARYIRERRERYRIKTVIEDGKDGRIVRKAALEPAAVGHIEDMAANGNLIKNLYRNTQVLQGSARDGVFTYAFAEGRSLDELFFDVRNDAEKFIAMSKSCVEKYYEFDEKYAEEFRITDRFTEIFGNRYPATGISLKYTNVDYVFHNIMIDGEKALVFDYEWVFDFPIPHEFVIWRSLSQLYGKYRMYLSGQISYGEYMKRMGFDGDKDDICQNMDKCFTEYVSGKGQEEVYTKNYVKKAYMQEMKGLY